MANKKELSEQELENVTGGVWTYEAKCYLAVNWDVIYATFNGDKNKFKGFINTYSNFDESKQVFDVDEAKTLLAYMRVDANKLVDYDPNNPEHVNKVNSELNF